MYILLKNTGIALSFSAALLFTQKAMAQAINTTHVEQQQLKVNNNEDEHSYPDSTDLMEEENHYAGINLSAEKMALANIVVATVSAKTQFHSISAPAEIKANGYKSYIVSPRIESVVISRHAMLGEHVQMGQKLVTLFSESMVQAQADYLIASTEWRRVKQLGHKTVSESRLLQAETTFNAAYGKLLAFGVTDASIKKIANKSSNLLGQYTLIAQRSGVVLEDNFLQGQRINAGETIMMLADEKDLWVEAQVSPNNKLDLSINTPAVVQFNQHSFPAKVIQEAHTIDPITRTRIIRLSVDNVDDTLHSGMFVQVAFQFATANKIMAVPENALIKSADGDWLIFVEHHQGEFTAVEVELGRSLGNLREITGLENGTRVVTQGAFFVASEIAKGGFDPHNH